MKVGFRISFSVSHKPIGKAFQHTICIDNKSNGHKYMASICLVGIGRY